MSPEADFTIPELKCFDPGMQYQDDFEFYSYDESPWGESDLRWEIGEEISRYRDPSSPEESMYTFGSVDNHDSNDP
jgi:hypothetical protein